MDAEILDLLERDLEAGFECLVLRYQHLVFGVAARVVGTHDAEDVAQEAFVRAYRALSRYPAERIRELRPAGWLARIALNTARNSVRGKSAQPRASLDDALDAVRDGDASPEEAWERSEADRTWRRLLDTLPETYRTAVELRHVEGLSYPDVARALGKPVGTVKANVHRGVRLLRAAYESEQRRVEQVA